MKMDMGTGTDTDREMNMDVDPENMDMEKDTDTEKDEDVDMDIQRWMSDIGKKLNPIFDIMPGSAIFSLILEIPTSGAVRNRSSLISESVPANDIKTIQTDENR
jgi:hypothetical protein